ncbi:Malectin/receptor-like protein kinase family protein [Euphorbia peplus]|nr:Malectin/receptor-like protein kinase family protein [Euphorbia peplus]
MFVDFFILVFTCIIIPFSAEAMSYYETSDLTAVDCSLPDPSSFSESLFHTKVSSVSRVYALYPDNQQKPRVAACVCRTQCTHTLSVSAGPSFIRFHFISLTYSGLNLSKALFSVHIGPYTLLNASESSYSNLIHSHHKSVLIREFLIISQGQFLNVTFTPSSKISGSYAFVNKIEIVSMPSMLYIQPNIPLPLISTSRNYSMMSSTALETIYRINVGGTLIPPHEDSGMFRFWGTDDFYFTSSNEDQTVTKYSRNNQHNQLEKLITSLVLQISALIRNTIIESEVEIRPSSYEAPLRVYATARTVLGKSDASNYSAKWSFPVESGFNYLVRLHFCEILSSINQLDFQFSETT